MNFELCDDCGIRLRARSAAANRNAQNSKSASWLLPCLHAFCSACDAQKSRLICPKCHIECCDKHILALPTPNDSLNRVCETAACPDKQTATMKCVQCNELLCEACGQAHRRVTATSSHTLQQIGSGCLDLTLCRHHNGRKLTVYCSCGALLCDECLSIPQCHDGEMHTKTPVQKLASISRIDENQVFSSALREKANIDYSLSLIQVRRNALDESVHNLRKELGNQVVQICQSVMRRGNDLLRALDTVTRCKTMEYDKLQEQLSRQKLRLERGAVNGLQRAPQVELKSSPESVVNALNQWGCVLSDLRESGVLKAVEVPPTPSTSNLLDVPMFRINNSSNSVTPMSFLSQSQQKSVIDKQSSCRHSPSVQLPTTSANILNSPATSSLNSSNISTDHIRMPTAFPLTHPQHMHFIQQHRFKLAQEVLSYIFYVSTVVAPSGETRYLSARIGPCPFTLDSGMARSPLSNPPQVMLPTRLSHYQQQPRHLNAIQQQPHSVISRQSTQNDSMLQLSTVDSTNPVITPIPASILMEEFDLNQFISSPNKMLDVQRSNELQPSTSLQGGHGQHSLRTTVGDNQRDTTIGDQNAHGSNNNNNSNEDNNNGVASNSSPPPKDPAPLKNAALKVKIRFSNATTITTTTTPSTATLINDPEHVSHKSAIEVACSSSEDASKNETRVVDEASKWDDYCYVCQQGCDERSGSLGCCAKCPRVYHNYCHIPPIKQPMESLPDEWACSSCMTAAPLIENSGVMGSRERLLCSKVLLKCYENFLQAEPFSRAVPKTVPNYYVIIKQPMDFATIARRLREKSKDAFTNVHQFIHSMNLVFENCSTFNPPDNEVAEAGRNVYNLYIKAVKEFLPCMKGNVWLYVNKYSETRNNMLIQKDYSSNYHHQPQSRNHLAETSTCEPVMKKMKKDIKNE
ncbi:unnamed protein product [Anisakis simplex]|uniref:B box-type domain-containing protein n=1 Tax=Anisakis simplex TaxID=6269 RepID=A0A0M3JZH5_ANISI|nr:unnamed protein product [Anisakis simplex]